MDFFMMLIIILLACLFLVLMLRPKQYAKTHAQKKEEITLQYQQKLAEALHTIEDADERQKQKIILLKRFAKELEFNLFFTKEEVKALIQSLAEY